MKPQSARSSRAGTLVQLRHIACLAAATLMLAGCSSNGNWLYTNREINLWQTNPLSDGVPVPPNPATVHAEVSKLRSAPSPIQQAGGLEFMPASPASPPAARPNGDNGKNGKNGDKEDNGDKKESEAKKPPKKMLEWLICKPDEGEKNNGEEKNGEQPEEEKPMPHDRPHFSDSAETVGLGRVMLESGYLFTRNNDRGTRDITHDYPESFLRIGMFAEWFEFRLGWNYFNESRTADGVRESLNGADDLDIGARFALTEQQKWLPETALTLSCVVPTGSSDFTANKVLPTVRYHYTWELIKDTLTLEGNTVAAGKREDSGHDYLEMAQAFAFEYTPTKKLELFAEWFAFFPHGAVDPTTGPEHYLHGGGTYYVTPNFGVDLHAAIGLNEHASDFFAGAGFIARY